MVAKRYKMQSLLARRLNLRPGYLSKLHKSSTEVALRSKRRADATCIDVVNNIRDFYKNPKVSRELPYMKTVLKQEQKYLLETSVESAYNLWKVDNPNQKCVSHSVFSKLRPFNVLLSHQTKLSQCLCEYCTGCLLKLQSLNRIIQATDDSNLKELKIKDKYELLNLSMCPKSDDNKYQERKCIERSCSECGIALLEERLKPLVDTLGDKTVSWLKWETKVYTQDDKQKSKKVQLTQTGTCKSLIDELCIETDFLAKHLFTANWQHDQFKYIRENLPNNWTTFVLDFAENYSCMSQDEIQSAHWAIQQVTLHPLVCYYKCQHPTHSHVVQEALVFLSDDLNHDASAVHHFESKSIEYLREKRDLKLDHIVEFTDGCSSQFKSKVPFADISYSQFSHRVSIERNYFGSRHGKGPRDGVSGVVKSAVRRSVMSRNVTVNNAEDMYNFCQLKLTKDSCDEQRCTFFLVKRGDIKRDRELSQVRSALVGTRLLHSVKCISPGVLDTRLLSCFCQSCTSDSSAPCSNEAYVLPWQRRPLIWSTTYLCRPHMKINKNMY